MDREAMINAAKNKVANFDVIIIGGGATGLGAAVDSASRGYSTLLLEQHDFSKGTSSRSTKLIHGGVRYLQQGNITLVLEALRERGLLLKNAPHLVHNQSFIVPNYNWWEGLFYGIGLKIYDLLSGKNGLGASRRLSLKKTLEYLPAIKKKGLRGGVLYYDGQFDDSRLAINLAQTAAEQGATLINYSKIVGFTKSGKLINGVKIKDQLTDEEYKINGKVVINATGVFTNQVLKMDDPDANGILSLSQGVHLVVDKKFSPGDSAIMVPHTEDGRVLFAVPWNGKIILGTTDTPVDSTSLEPKALDEEIEFILKHASQYLAKNPTRKDVQSVFAGLRPLVKSGNGEKTSSLSREHTLVVSDSGLITITGGKWTTYRSMGKETIDKAISEAGLTKKECVTENLRVHGWHDNVIKEEPLHQYGSDQTEICKLIKEQPELGKPLHKKLPYLKAEVIWGVRNEMAMTVEDILARRTRALLLNATASIESAPLVAKLMAAELNKDEHWQKQQISDYTTLALTYILDS